MFGKGKTYIDIPKTYYSPGDIISGTVILDMKKPVMAREVNISLIGERKIRRRVSTGSGGRRSTTTERIRIYDFQQRLDGEKEYSQRTEYAFEIKIPADVPVVQSPLSGVEGALGDVLEITESVTTMMGVNPFQHTEWYLLAKLDIPGGMDIRRKADITIG